MPEDIFRGPKLKIERANTHVDNLTSEIKAFTNSEPYEIVRENDPGRGKDVILARSVKPVPDMVDVLVGEILYNLRSALDHMACALARANGFDNVKNVYFPFAGSYDEFMESATQKKIKKLPAWAIDMIRGWKPYRGGNNLLWGMSKLSSTDKHQSFIPIGMKSQSRIISGGTFKGTGISIVGSSNWDRLDKGIEIFAVDPGGKFQTNISIAIDIAFGGENFIEGQTVIGTLNKMTNLIQEIVTGIDARFKI